MSASEWILVIPVAGAAIASIVTAYNSSRIKQSAKVVEKSTEVLTTDSATHGEQLTEIHKVTNSNLERVTARLEEQTKLVLELQRIISSLVDNSEKKGILKEARAEIAETDRVIIKIDKDKKRKDDVIAENVDIVKSKE